MQIKVEAVSKNSTVYDNKTRWGVMLPDKSWVSFHREQKPMKGEVLDVNITERPDKNDPKKIWRDAFPIMAAPTTMAWGGNGQVAPQAPQPPPVTAPAEEKKPDPNAGKINWNDYLSLAKDAHSLAVQLEPDIPTTAEAEERGEKYIDRAPARVGFVNKILEHYAYGKIFVPKEDDDYVPPPEDDIPPF